MPELVIPAEISVDIPQSYAEVFGQDKFIDLYVAHTHSRYHRKEIESSNSCGCFYCFNMFLPCEIKEWTDNGTTALCPNCRIDAVIGSSSGFKITLGFLRGMHDIFMRSGNKKWY